MSSLPFRLPVKRGRPRLVELTTEQGHRLAQLYLATNRTRNAGSMEAAWVLFCEETGLFPHTHKHHRLVGTLPTAAHEIMSHARGLVIAKRGGAKELRLKGPYQQGGMRLHWEHPRRLYAGESYSVDDLTRNVAVWIPWPYGGDPCSEKYGVRLGRWQTLAVCDDASWAIPAVSSVFRHAESYRGADAASLIYQTETKVGMAGFTDEARWIIEGGVWQSQHALAVLGDRYHSAKGRPGQKLIERWFGAMQTLDAVWNRDLGRQRGEILKNNQLWLDCRAGKKDPRQYFPSFHEAMETLRHLIQYMNEREVRSEIYGKWIPQDRWDADTAAHPLTLRRGDAHLLQPQRRPLKVTRAGTVSCTVMMADGIKRRLAWNAPELYAYIGRTILLCFDSQDQWPLTGTALVPGTNKIICHPVCQNPYGQSRDADRERVAAIRSTMLTDLKIILGSNAGHRITTSRTPSGKTEIENLPRSEADPLAAREKNQRAPGTPAVLHPQRNRGGGDLFSTKKEAPLPDRYRPTHSPNLTRRAQRARQQLPNW